MTSQALKGIMFGLSNRLLVMQICDFRSDFTNIMGIAIWLISSNEVSSNSCACKSSKDGPGECYREKQKTRGESLHLEEDIAFTVNLPLNTRGQAASDHTMGKARTHASLIGGRNRCMGLHYFIGLAETFHPLITALGKENSLWRSHNTMLISYRSLFDPFRTFALIFMFCSAGPLLFTC